MPKVTIILLNWNGWKDTIQCLETLFHGDYRDFRAVVCDNLSSDGSLDKIRDWAEGKLTCADDLNRELLPLITPLVKKPVPYVVYSQAEAENGGIGGDEDVPLVLVRNEANDGFSAGNNVGIRFALHKKSEYIWLLNNDTVVAASALRQLVRAMEADPDVGLMGTAIHLASNPSELQTYGGGRIIPLLGMDRFVRVPGSIDYIAGTSLFMRRETVEQTGLLDDGFFFYWEDADYSRRAKKKGWKLEVAGNAAVYHKFSASVQAQSLKSDLFKVASLTRYFKKHYRFRWFIPVGFNISGMIINRLFRKQFDRVLPILRECRKALSKKLPHDS